jgi:pimeloyl-ACP methyl ester carboxylesterase
VDDLPGVGRYRIAGEGPAVVVLSNPQADPDWWTPPIASALTAAGYRVVTFVHTGADHRPAAVARDVGTLLDHLVDRLGGGPVRLLGWSQGAAIAQEVALLRPDRVAAAALIAGYARQNTMDRVLQQAWRALDAADAELDPVRLALMLLTSYPAARLGDDEFLDGRIAGARRWSATSGPLPDSRVRSRAFIDAYQDRLGALAAIEVPCLVIGFGQDADTFVTRAREVGGAVVAGRSDGSEYLELPDAGHLTPVTDPDRVTGPVLRFFAGIDATDRVRSWPPTSSQ